VFRAIVYFVPSSVLYQVVFAEARKGKTSNPERAAARAELSAVLGHPEAFWPVDLGDGDKTSSPVVLKVCIR
jgi:hypothetical protein